MKLYFVRHGETDVNSGLQPAYTAQFDEPLNSAGIAQAEQIAERLKNATFNAVISSPARRALQTVNIINEFHKLDIQIDGAWRELSTSAYLDAASWHEAFNFDRNEGIESVEPIRDFFERIYAAINNIRAAYGKDNAILVVSHGGVHQAVHAYVNNLRLAGNMRMSPIKNCELKVYEL